MKGPKIRIRIEAYDYKLMDQAIRDIVSSITKSGAQVVGPIPLPTTIERYTVLSSPHVDKKAREQFEIRTHKRIMDLINPTPKTMEALRNLNVPAGIEIQIKA